MSERAASPGRATALGHWWVVFASVLGLAVGSGPVKTFTFGIFLKPLVADLHLDRSTLSLAFFIANMLTTLGLPLLGWCFDRYGVRRTMLPWVALFAAATAAQGLLIPSLPVVYLLFSLVGLSSTAQTPVPYSKVISAWFDRRRGLALGIGVAGVGLGTALVPPLTQALMTAFGWRWAYLGLGIVTFAVAIPAIGLFLREPARDGNPGEGRRARDTLPGLAVREALLGSWRFWVIAAAFFIATVAVNGVLTNIVPLLTDRGLSPAAAAGVLSAVGFCLTAGRLLGGVALDRVFAPLVAAFFFLLPLAGVAILRSGSGGAWPFIGGVLCGLGIGAEIDIAAYLTSRYIGLRAFGTLYGIVFGMTSLANAAGPYVMNKGFDMSGSYDGALALFEGLLALAAIMILPLGPYAYPAAGSRDPAAERDAA